MGRPEQAALHVREHRLALIPWDFSVEARTASYIVVAIDGKAHNVVGRQGSGARVARCSRQFCVTDRHGPTRMSRQHLPLNEFTSPSTIASISFGCVSTCVTHARSAGTSPASRVREIHAICCRFNSAATRSCCAISPAIAGCVKHTTGSGVSFSTTKPPAASRSQEIAHRRLVLEARRDAGLSVLGEQHEQLQAYEPTRPLHAGDEVVGAAVARLLGHIGGVGLERRFDGGAMAAEEHAGADRNREPLMRIARDRVGALDAGERRAQAI
jgi:hypothetical protein